MNDFFTDKRQIDSWMRSIDIRDFRINDDLTVDVKECFTLHEPCKKLPIQLGHVDGYFNVDRCGLTTLEGCPRTITNYFSCDDNSLTDLRFITPDIPENFYCQRNYITSLIGVADLVKNLSGMFAFDVDKIRHGGLGLLLIENMNSIAGQSADHVSIATAILHGNDTLIHNGPFSIIRRYLGQPDKLFQCQQELIDAGYPDHAIL